ncbi:hypothetical protein BST61_g11614 [Cercospora zeina]
MIEPLANIGQWAPIAGTGLAVLGAIYVLLGESMTRERERREMEAVNPGSGAAEDSGPLHQIAKVLISLGDHISNPKRHRFDTSEFRSGQRYGLSRNSRRIITEPSAITNQINTQ